MVTHLPLLPLLSLKRQRPSTLQLVAAAGRVIHHGCIYPSVLRCGVCQEAGQGLEWLLEIVPTRIIFDMWHASLGTGKKAHEGGGAWAGAFEIVVVKKTKHDPPLPSGTKLSDSPLNEGGKSHDPPPKKHDIFGFIQFQRNHILCMKLWYCLRLKFIFLIIIQNHLKIRLFSFTLATLSHVCKF